MFRRLSIIRLFSLTLMVFLLILCIVYYKMTFRVGQYRRELSYKRIISKEDKDTKFIYFATRWWHDSYPFLEEAKAKCPKCEFQSTFTDFRHEIHLEMSDALVFHGYSLNPTPPSHNRENQVWVYFYFEAPVYLGDYVKQTANYTDMFNWTMTYRLDSDVPTPYGRFVPFSEIPMPKFEDASWAFLPSAIPGKLNVYDPNFMKVPSPDQIRKKTKLVAWIAAHCPSHSRRESVVALLAKHIPVDIYGKCGNLSCEVPKEQAQSGIDCRFQISPHYKFYLAFENSLCEDYVTEKFWETLHTQMVPVVYGGANYAALYPPNSFINVADFESLETLAKYLKFLDGNEEAYLKYFQWRKEYWVLNNRFVEGYCSLCRKLWDQDKDPSKSKSYNNLTAWWFGRSDYKTSNGMACSSPSSEYMSSSTSIMQQATISLKTYHYYAINVYLIAASMSYFY